MGIVVCGKVADLYRQSFLFATGTVYGKTSYGCLIDNKKFLTIIRNRTIMFSNTNSD